MTIIIFFKKTLGKREQKQDWNVNKRFVIPVNKDTTPFYWFFNELIDRPKTAKEILFTDIMSWNSRSEKYLNMKEINQTYPIFTLDK